MHGDPVAGMSDKTGGHADGAGAGAAGHSFAGTPFPDAGVQVAVLTQVDNLKVDPVGKDGVAFYQRADVVQGELVDGLVKEGYGVGVAH